MSEYQTVLLRQLGEEIAYERKALDYRGPAWAMACIFSRRPILAHALINAF